MQNLFFLTSDHLHSSQASIPGRGHIPTPGSIPPKTFDLHYITRDETTTIKLLYCVCVVYVILLVYLVFII